MNYSEWISEATYESDQKKDLLIIGTIGGSIIRYDLNLLQNGDLEIKEYLL